MNETRKIVIDNSLNNYYVTKVKDDKHFKEPRKRIVAEKWTFSHIFFENENQIRLLQKINKNIVEQNNDIVEQNNDKAEQNNNKAEQNNDIVEQNNDIVEQNNDNDNIEYVIKVVIQQIKKKISSYKQQDIIKKKFCSDKFISFKDIIKQMVECALKCCYCKENMFVLYDISRELKQWSVDRIDNGSGHNIDNFHLSCLDCNLKRRCRTNDKYMFTKELNIVKLTNKEEI
jgi:hypothetical protein